MVMRNGSRPPWWVEGTDPVEDLAPIVVSIPGEILESMALSLASLCGRESVIIPVRSAVSDVAWGFRLTFPDKAEGAVPPGDQAGRDRLKRQWRNVSLAPLRTTPEGEPVSIPLLAEGDERLWSADVRIEDHVVLRCGVVSDDRPGPELARGAEMLSRRIEALIWDRVGTFWKRGLEQALGETVENETDGEGFHRQMNALAREAARILGCCVVGLFTWREARRGYVLDGYFGPKMPGPIENSEESSWWFHSAADPSLVRDASNPDEGTQEGARVLLWRADKDEDAILNAAAVGEFRTAHGTTPLAAAMAVKLPISGHPLRPILVAFGTKGTAWPEWTERVRRAWETEVDGEPPSIVPMDRLHRRAFRGMVKGITSVLEQRAEWLRWKVVRIASSWGRHARQSQEQAKEILGMVCELAGAWSGALWALSGNRVKALALMHPLEKESYFEWREMDGENSLGRRLEDLSAIRSKFVLTQLSFRHDTWMESTGGGGRWRPVVETTNTWLVRNSCGRTDAVMATLVLGPVEAPSGALSLIWWAGPDKDGAFEKKSKELNMLLSSVLDRAGGVLVALIEIEREDFFHQEVDVAFHSWSAKVRTGDAGGLLARVPAHYVADVLRRVSRLLGLKREEIHFFRYEEWSDGDHNRGDFRDPVVRRLAPEPEEYPLHLDDDLVADLRQAAKTAEDGQPIDPVAVTIPMEGRAIDAAAFPAVIGGEVAGFLAIEGRLEPMERNETAREGTTRQLTGRQLAVWQRLALNVGRTAELIRRHVYRRLDDRIEELVEGALRGSGPKRRITVPVASELAELTQKAGGARWTAVLQEGDRGRVRHLAAAGSAPTAESFGSIRSSWTPLERVRNRGDHCGWVFDPANAGPVFEGSSPGATGGVVLPLRSPGAFHGWLVAVAGDSWSLDDIRVLEALALRTGPFLAHAMELDRLFLTLAGAQHATRSAWSQAAGGADLLTARLKELRAFDMKVQNAMDMLDEGLERASVRMASALYLATGGEVEDRSRAETPASFNQLIKRVTKMYRILARDKKCKIEENLPLTPIPLPGETRLVQLVVENLVENAVKYARHGGRIWVRLRAKTGLATLSVGDEGEALARAHWEALLKPFARGDSSGTPGFGIGLSVVADCCRRMGATLEAPLSRATGDHHEVEITIRFPMKG